ncbi:hypothetical protein [Methylobacter sp.]|uniref:hypothetical protein n=1 Tax=Methylobacter sp. TaxID=2051955 RepID=UPI003DA22C5A
MGKRNGHLYVIEGDITPLTRSTDKKRIWDFITSFRINSHISLQHQHGEYEKLEGPLHLECTFYLPFFGSDLKAKHYKHRYHMAKPYLSGLLVLVETVGVDIIFRSTANIVSVNLEKLYDNDRPRVEFKLFEIKAKEYNE